MSEVESTNCRLFASLVIEVNPEKVLSYVLHEAYKKISFTRQTIIDDAH